MGLGAGGILRANGSGGGTDFYSIYYMMRTNKNFGTINFVINFLIIFVLGLTSSFEIALYAIINLYAMTIAIGYIFTNHEKLTLIIITSFGTARLITDDINKVMYRGATIINSRGAYKNDDKEMIYMVVSKHEVRRISEIAHSHDKDIFVNVLETKDVIGNFFEKYHYK